MSSRAKFGLVLVLGSLALVGCVKPKFKKGFMLVYPTQTGAVKVRYQHSDGEWRTGAVPPGSSTELGADGGVFAPGLLRLAAWSNPKGVEVRLGLGAEVWDSQQAASLPSVTPASGPSIATLVPASDSGWVVAYRTTSDTVALLRRAGGTTASLNLAPLEHNENVTGRPSVAVGGEELLLVWSTTSGIYVGRADATAQLPQWQVSEVDLEDVPLGNSVRYGPPQVAPAVTWDGAKFLFALTRKSQCTGHDCLNHEQLFLYEDKGGASWQLASSRSTLLNTLTLDIATDGKTVMLVSASYSKRAAYAIDEGAWTQLNAEAIFDGALRPNTDIGLVGILGSGG